MLQFSKIQIKSEVKYGPQQTEVETTHNSDNIYENKFELFSSNAGKHENTRIYRPRPSRFSGKSILLLWPQIIA
jgi:hypothetical protein